MDWEHRNVLITGATGLLGGWLAKELVRKGANVIALVRDGVPASPFFSEGIEKRVTCVKGSLEDYFLVERALNEYEVETCFHLGAQTIVGTANRSPISTFESNIRGTWNVLEAARNSKLLKALVVASSDKAYGKGKLPYTEDSPLEAKHPYDVSKACGDMLARSYFETYGLPVGITRCGNLFGGVDLNFNRIVPGTIRSLILGERPVIRSDGKMVRDYIYVEDIVNANLLLARTLMGGRERGEAFNFSWEAPLSVIEIVGEISKVMKSGLKPQILCNACNEIPEQYLSSEKARKRLGWVKEWGMESGLEKTVEYYKRMMK